MLLERENTLSSYHVDLELSDRSQDWIPLEIALVL